MTRYALAFVLLLLIGCSGANRPMQLSDTPTTPSRCFGHDICTASTAIVRDEQHLKIVVSGIYHPIKAANIWIDGTTYPLQLSQSRTVYNKTLTGLRASVHRFSIPPGIRNKLQQGVRVKLYTDLQSYSLSHTLKRPGYTDTQWHTLLAAVEPEHSPN
ncbi:hypothetical protein SAMN03080615_03623 [Amphritea atlantica]|uniref:Uncharacterized protein n=1 Tax=Amphritea atlantica TaxID=355243 RepID=A0A1H9KRN7_9GAMM|nr:hypothetical protein [Amphritea atlantica]SER01831.1 hypothetical protein SAMN03080615_03623 [Amphritea atlantica]